MGLSCLTKGIMLPLTFKGFNSLLLMYINTLYGLMYMLIVKPLNHINILWLGVYIRYTPEKSFVVAMVSRDTNLHISISVILHNRI